MVTKNFLLFRDSVFPQGFFRKKKSIDINTWIIFTSKQCFLFSSSLHLGFLSFQSGDTVLIGAVRGGHVEIVRALLQKYADIDIRGQVRVNTVLFPMEISL